MSNTDPLLEAITPKTGWYVVLRPFQGDGDARYVRGEVVNAENWTHTKRLVELRYVATLPHGVPVPEVDADGRRMIVLEPSQEAQVPEKKRPAPTRKTK